VLGPDVVVLERPRLVLSQHDDLAGTLCEPLEQGSRMVAEGPAAAETALRPQKGTFLVSAGRFPSTTEVDGACGGGFTLVKGPLPSRCRSAGFDVPAQAIVGGNPLERVRGPS
jgi:hypothetical protein